jgi:hypothetical protein
MKYLPKLSFTIEFSFLKKTLILRVIFRTPSSAFLEKAAIKEGNVLL